MGAGVLQLEPNRCYLYVGRMDFQGTTAWLYFCCSHCVYSCCRDGEAHMEVRGQLVRSVLSGIKPSLSGRSCCPVWGFLYIQELKSSILVTF